LISYHKYEP